MDALLALGILLAQGEGLEPGQFEVVLGAERHLLPRASFETTGNLLTVSVPGQLSLTLTKTATGWASTRDTHFLRLDGRRSGRLETVVMRLDALEGETVTGSWSGVFVDGGTRLRVRGQCHLASREALDPKPSVFLAGVGCVVLAFLLLVNAAVSIWFIVTAFNDSLLWGLAVLALPLAPIVFAVLHWEAAKRPFLASLGVGVASVLILALMAATM